MGATNKAGLKGLAVLAAGFSLFLSMGAASAFGQQKRGATVVVTRYTGAQSGGELIAVKPDSLLLLDAAGKDSAVPLAEIHCVLVIRKSKVGQGLLLGLLGGGATGYIAGSIQAKTSGACPGCEAPLMRLGWGILGATVGTVIGVIAGASAGSDQNIVLDSTPGPARTAALRRLNKFARVKNFR